MSITADDIAAFAADDPTDDDSTSLGDALSDVAVDVEVDAVEAVRELRERRSPSPP